MSKRQQGGRGAWAPRPFLRFRDEIRDLGALPMGEGPSHRQHGGRLMAQSIALSALSLSKFHRE